MYHGPLRTTSPPTRINDDLQLNQKYHALLIKHTDAFAAQTFRHPLIVNGPNDNDTFVYATFLKHSFVYVITETVADYPYAYLSEKTWKAFSTKMPFMLIGSKGSVQQLKNFGFRTFDSWWCEDYDNLQTAAERIEAVILELKKLSELSLSQLTQMKKEIESVVDYNFEHLRIFKKNDLDNLQQTI